MLALGDSKPVPLGAGNVEMVVRTIGNGGDFGEEKSICAP